MLADHTLVGFTTAGGIAAYLGWGTHSPDLSLLVGFLAVIGGAAALCLVVRVLRRLL
jgi:hypothetical protein